MLLLDEINISDLKMSGKVLKIQEIESRISGPVFTRLRTNPDMKILFLREKK